MKITKVSSRWEEIVLICRKCSKRVDGGFGAKGKTRLDKALRTELDIAKGKKARIGLIMAPCFDLCPKDGVTVACGSKPGALYVAKKGADVREIAQELGLEPQETVITWPFKRVSSSQ
jgi:hypothetical protein